MECQYNFLYSYFYQLVFKLVTLAVQVPRLCSLSLGKSRLYITSLFAPPAIQRQLSELVNFLVCSGTISEFYSSCAKTRASVFVCMSAGCVSLHACACLLQMCVVISCMYVGLLPAWYVLG